MQNVERIWVVKDDKLVAALGQAAALNAPDASEADLLRYLALVGSENLPEPYMPPTPEQTQRAIDSVMKLSARWMRERGIGR